MYICLQIQFIIAIINLYTDTMHTFANAQPVLSWQRILRHELSWRSYIATHNFLETNRVSKLGLTWLSQLPRKEAIRVTRKTRLRRYKDMDYDDNLYLMRYSESKAYSEKVLLGLLISLASIWCCIWHYLWAVFYILLCQCYQVDYHY